MYAVIRFYLCFVCLFAIYHWQCFISRCIIGFTCKENGTSGLELGFNGFKSKRIKSEFTPKVALTMKLKCRT